MCNYFRKLGTFRIIESLRHWPYPEITIVNFQIYILYFYIYVHIVILYNYGLTMHTVNLIKILIQQIISRSL